MIQRWHISATSEYGMIESKNLLRLPMLDGEWVKYEDHEQALTEKGREIQQIREHEFQNGYREGEAAMMAQAVRFAALVCECWGSNCNMIDAQEYEEARTFLKERL